MNGAGITLQGTDNTICPVVDWWNIQPISDGQIAQGLDRGMHIIRNKMSAEKLREEDLKLLHLLEQMRSQIA